MDRVACQTSFPVGKEGASTHALRVSFEGEGGGAVRFAGGLDVDYGLAGWGGVCSGGKADFLEIGFGDAGVC